MVVRIQLTRGLEAIVDDDDADLVLASPRKWVTVSGNQKRVSTVHYAIRRRDDRYEHLLMHRLILDAPAHMEVDHRNGDGLDNQRSNLRLATKSQNAINRRVGREKTSSRFRGVCWSKTRGMWQVVCKKDGKAQWGGLYGVEEEAALAYDRIARIMHGEFATLNFPEVS